MIDSDDVWISALGDAARFVEETVPILWKPAAGNPLLARLHREDADFLVNVGLPSTQLSCIQEIGFAEWTLAQDAKSVLLEVGPGIVRVSDDRSVTLHDGDWSAWANSSVELFSVSLAVFCKYWDATVHKNRDVIARFNNTLWNTLTAVEPTIGNRSDCYWSGVSDWVGFL